MLRNACIGLSLATLATVADAQTPSPAKSFDYAGYVEGARPRMAVRKLSGAEKGQMKTAIAAWKKSKSEASLAALRPFAEAGDIDALKTMFEAYGELRRQRGMRGASDTLQDPTFGLIPVTALWGIAYARAGGKVDPVKSAMSECTGNSWDRPEDGSNMVHYDRTVVIDEGKVPDFDCGFDLRGTQAQIAYFDFRNGKAPARPGAPAELIERPVLSQQAMDEAKLPKALEDVRLAKATYHDRQWLAAWSARDPAVKAKYDKVRFEERMYFAERDGKPVSQTDEKDLWDYMMTDPNRQYSQMIALSRNFDKTSANSQRFANAMSTGDFKEREWSSWIAVNNNQSANQWWTIYRGNLSGNTPGLDAWCRVGIGAACQQKNDQQAAQEFRDKYGDPASLNSGRFAGASGSIDQGQFLKERADARAACLKANVNGGAACTE